VRERGGGVGEGWGWDGFLGVGVTCVGGICCGGSCYMWEWVGGT